MESLKIKKINLGCGYRFHPDWVNVDFIKTHESVIAHNLLEGIPFEDHSFDVVYHSHVLEHFTKVGAVDFIKECQRILKPNGVIRIAVPDLEGIARSYVEQLDLIDSGNKSSIENANWMRLELIDQMVRMTSGGEMVNYLQKDELTNEEFVFQRIGEEGKNLRKMILSKTKGSSIGNSQEVKREFKVNPFRFFTTKYYRSKLRNYFLKPELERIIQNNRFAEVGKFRLSGEVHQWMYDRFSLSELLINAGFTDTKVCTSYESAIPEWIKYELDQKADGTIIKPDSLFMEARKK